MAKVVAMIDLDQFESTAAWLQYCDGMTQFQAETEAARRQGVIRSEVLAYAQNDKRDTGQARHIGKAPERHNPDNLPAMQRGAQEQERPLPKRDIQA